MGCHFFLQGDLPDPETKPRSPALAGRVFTTGPPGKPVVRNWLIDLVVYIVYIGDYGQLSFTLISYSVYTDMVLAHDYIIEFSTIFF